MSVYEGPQAAGSNLCLVHTMCGLFPASSARAGRLSSFVLTGILRLENPEPLNTA